MSPTIKDVAKHAGVSVATVSRYLNNSPLIAPASIEKVRASMDELHYQPNFIAKSLSKQESLNIAFVVDGSNIETTGNDYFLRIQYGAERRLSEEGYFLLVISIDGAGSGNQMIETLIKAKRIDGMILPVELASDSLTAILKKLEFPFVIYGKNQDQSIYSLDLDNTMGGRVAAEKLIQNECKKIKFITNTFSKIFALERYEGYKEALIRTGLTVRADYVVEGCYDYQDGYNYVMQEKDLCDGYIVTDNIVAFGMLRAMEERHIKVPESVKLVGFDNTILAQVSTPPMTVIEIDVTELGRKAASMLMAQLKHSENAERQCLLPVSIVERGTTI